MKPPRTAPRRDQTGSRHGGASDHHGCEAERGTNLIRKAAHSVPPLTPALWGLEEKPSPSARGVPGAAPSTRSFRAPPLRARDVLGSRQCVHSRTCRCTVRRTFVSAADKPASRAAQLWRARVASSLVKTGVPGLFECRTKDGDRNALPRRVEARDLGTTSAASAGVAPQAALRERRAPRRKAIEAALTPHPTPRNDAD